MKASYYKKEETSTSDYHLFTIQTMSAYIILVELHYNSKNGKKIMVGDCDVSKGSLIFILLHCTFLLQLIFMYSTHILYAPRHLSQILTYQKKSLSWAVAFQRCNIVETSLYYNNAGNHDYKS